MAITSIKAEIGVNGANGIVFLGGTTALNMLGEVSSGCSVPETWKAKLNTFLSCKDEESFTLGGCDIIRTGFYVKARNMQFKQTEHGDKGPAYWELADNVAGMPKAELAATMRTLLTAPGTKCDPWVATLTAAMFLSEVARNPRSFMINLMLLDLIEGGVKYGSQANKEVDFKKLLKFDGGNRGKSKQYQYSGTDPVTVGVNAQPGTVRGGKLPMSQKDAMEQYQKSVDKFEYKKNFDAYAKQSRLNLDAPANGGDGYHFSSALLEKECTVVLRWLLAYFAKRPLHHQTGSEKVAQAVKGWGPTPTMTMVDKAITVPVALTGLRTHVREKDWTDAETTDARAKTVTGAAKLALRARQTAVAMQL